MVTLQCVLFIFNGLVLVSLAVIADYATGACVTLCGRCHVLALYAAAAG